jgi:hypothetical protein
MAKSATQPLPLARQLDVLYPKREEVLPVPVSEWRRIMECLNTMDKTPKHLDALGWACIGIAASAFLTALTLPLSVQWFTEGSDKALRPNIWAFVIEGVCGVLAISCIIGGIASLVFSHFVSGYQKKLGAMTAEQMQHLLESHAQAAPMAQTTNVPTPAEQVSSASTPETATQS